MLWQTHIRIANEVSQRLGIPKSTIEAGHLNRQYKKLKWKIKRK